MTTRILGVAVAIAVSGVAADAQGQYKFTDLGALIPGEANSDACAINASGEVVGGFTLSTGAGGGFLYSNGTVQILTAFGVGTGVAAGGPSGINDAGMMAGTLGISGVGYHACVYSNGTLTDLGTTGGADSEATAINDSGQVVGWSNPAPGQGSEDAFLYGNGTMTDLDALLGGAHHSTALAINNSGQVLCFNGGSAFVFNNGAVTTIAPPVPSTLIVPYGINDAGQVVGGMSSSGGGLAFLWSAAKGVTELGTLTAPYDGSSAAVGISDNGQVVGTSYSPPLPNGGEYPHAFVWSNGTMQDLNNLTSAPGFTLNNAWAINASGQIVGNAQVNGVSPTTDIAFLLTPLEPGDANGDGRVDVNDLTIVLTNFGRTGTTWSQGDFNANGTVNVNDLTIVLSNYGYGVTSNAGASAVPEPSALALLVAAAALAPLAFRRRQRNPHTPRAERDMEHR